MNKKIFSLFLAVTIILSSLAFSLTAYAKSIEIVKLDSEYGAVIDGIDDQITFLYTPEESGTYSFLSYNLPASEAYLFIKEKDPETGMKTYTQLAYSKGNSDYQNEKYSQPNKYQFCITYHLEKGVRYYFKAGWRDGDKRTDGFMKVKLICEGFDSDGAIIDLSVSCPTKLEAFTNGSWKTDSSGNRYFLYDINRILNNMTVTITLKDGTVLSATGSDRVGDYYISYTCDQEKNHWYMPKDPLYNGNVMTIKVFDKTVDYHVEIINPGLYAVKIFVTDYLGNPIEGAKIYNNNNLIETYNDANGVYTFSAGAGQVDYRIVSSNAIDRTVTAIIAASASENDFTDQPIKMFACEYIKDGVINTKDFSYIIKNLPEDEAETKSAELRQVINMTKNDYPKLTLN